MRGMARTGRPGRIDQRVVQILLNIVDQLLAARGDAECLDIGSGIVNDGTIAGTERTDNILLEKWDQFPYAE